jgi:hypothetical protein
MLYFALGNATEAVQQFQRHTRLYKSLQSLPHPEREYEHWAWVSREYVSLHSLSPPLSLPLSFCPLTLLQKKKKKEKKKKKKTKKRKEK